MHGVMRDVLERLGFRKRDALCFQHPALAGAVEHENDR
jgi:hypothetical protein